MPCDDPADRRAVNAELRGDQDRASTGSVQINEANNLLLGQPDLDGATGGLRLLVTTASRTGNQGAQPLSLVRTCSVRTSSIDKVGFSGWEAGRFSFESALFRPGGSTSPPAVSAAAYRLGCLRDRGGARCPSRLRSISLRLVGHRRTSAARFWLTLVLCRICATKSASSCPTRKPGSSSRRSKRVTRAIPGPVVVDTGVFGARLATGRSDLDFAYRPLLVGHPLLISFVTVAELRFGARIAEGRSPGRTARTSSRDGPGCLAYRRVQLDCSNCTLVDIPLVAHDAIFTNIDGLRLVTKLGE